MTTLDIEEARRLSEARLQDFGFAERCAELMTKNMLEAEMAGKDSHGFIRVHQLEDLLEK